MALLCANWIELYRFHILVNVVWFALLAVVWAAWVLSRKPQSNPARRLRLPLRIVQPCLPALAWFMAWESLTPPRPTIGLGQVVAYFPPVAAALLAIDLAAMLMVGRAYIAIESRHARISAALLGATILASAGWWGIGGYARSVSDYARSQIERRMPIEEFQALIVANFANQAEDEMLYPQRTGRYSEKLPPALRLPGARAILVRGAGPGGKMGSIRFDFGDRFLSWRIIVGLPGYRLDVSDLLDHARIYKWRDGVYVIAGDSYS